MFVWMTIGSVGWPGGDGGCSVIGCPTPLRALADRTGAREESADIEEGQVLLFSRRNL